jgi:hypothetical protein
MKIPTALLILALIAGLFYCARPARAGIDVDGQGNGSGNKSNKFTAQADPLKKMPPRKIKPIKRIQR